MTRVTIATVAKAAGVHISTVSRALNPRTQGMIRPEVVARVSAAAERLGYRRNAVAAALRLQRSQMIGVIIPDITNPVFPPILRAIEDVLAVAGYIAIIANTDNSRARQQMVIERMLERSVDGLILASVTRDDAFLAKLDAPLVMINRATDSAVTSVVSDDAVGIRAAMAHLVALGHRDIVHIGGPLRTSTGLARQEAFVGAMHTHGLVLRPDAIAVAEQFSIADGTAALRALLDRRATPTAIIAGNDLLAVGCYDALDAIGLRCPQDVSVIGFNDMPYADRFSPPLTTVRIRHYEMGEVAAGLLLRQIAEPDSRVETVVLAPELILRASCANPAGGLPV